MSLHLHRAERTDQLARGLADLLTDPLPDPFATELVVVPARGVERWLTQRLSHRLGAGGTGEKPGDSGGDGVCAGVRFASPWSLTSELLGATGEDPWEPDHLTWPVLETLDESLSEPWATVLARHLGEGSGPDDGWRRERRWSVARRLAGLFASYSVQRPDLLRDWESGGSLTPPDLAWQPQLWRLVVERIEAPSPSQRLDTVLAELRHSDIRVALPPRLSLFGHTRIPTSEFRLLHALAAHVEVHLWLPQPSARLWESLRPLVSGTGQVPRGEDRTAALVEHPLLASLGRDSRELQRTLLTLPPATDDSVDTACHPRPETLLGWLQADLRGNVLPTDRDRRDRVLDPAKDRSVQVHACHGTARQVDVLREALVGLLADDPTLEPRDILVMCPDVEGFAPLFAAGFGMAEAAGPDDEEFTHPAHRLRVRLADRSLTATNPLLALAATLVHLVGGRMTSVDLVDLASSEPVRRRFGFDDEDIELVAEWVAAAGVRWGLNTDQRAGFGLDLADNTWRRGLDRLLLGAAISEQQRAVVGQVLPLDDAAADLDLVGRLAEFVDRLHAFERACARARSAEDWFGALGTAVHGLASPPSDQAWQLAQFDRELARISGAAGSGTTLRLADLRALLTQRLGGRPTRSNFRTGTLTVCTMVPMRSVPHRVVALVGLDDGVFPRIMTPDGDDVLARDPQTGERDLRAEDRQLFLDAVLAAGETLIITYTGAGEQTGLPRPPAVPVGELLDALDDTASHPRPPRTVRDAVLIQHPLQPFDARNLVHGALQTDRTFSFDRTALEGARAARGPREPIRSLVPTPLSPEPPDDLSLADLRDFFDHPVRFFLRHRLGISGSQRAGDLPTGIPIELDGLEKWAVGDRILADVLGGLEPSASMLAALHRGQLPPGRLGTRTLEQVVNGIRPLHALALRFQTGEPRTLDVDITLRDGRRLTGTVSDLYGNNLVRVTYSTLSAKHRLGAWLDLIALRLGHEDESWVSHAIGRFGRNARHAQIGPLDERAEDWLSVLVDLYDRGRCEPLPLPLKTSLAWAEEDRRVRRGMTADPIEKASKEWVTDRFAERPFPKEQDDMWLSRAFGASADLSVLLDRPRDDELFDETPGAESRLGQYARRLWEPLLDEERMGGL